MPEHSPAALVGPVVAAALLPVTLGDLDATQRAQLLVAPPHLIVDCGGVCAPHPSGVCRLVSYLLLLHQRGTSIRLRNVHPVLHRCLRQLKLSRLFQLSR